MSIASSTAARPDDSIRLTISVGVAALAVTGVGAADRPGLPDLLAAADAALYHAKQTGRNKTHLAAASPSGTVRRDPEKSGV
jgi:PleD family two-component response regulator